jgi:hypothetical protein
VPGNEVGVHARNRQIGESLLDFDALAITSPKGSTLLEPKVMAVPRRGHADVAGKIQAVDEQST